MSDATSSWMGNGATASLLGNDVAVYGGGESLWVLSLPSLTWSEVWTTGKAPPHGLRFHTAVPLRLPLSGGDAASAAAQQQRSASQDSTGSATSSSTFSALVVTGGEPRFSADLPECVAYGPTLNLHALNVRQRAWSLISATGDVPLNRCFHSMTKLRGTTVAVFGGRPIGGPNRADEMGAPIWDDSEATMAKLTAQGFYDVFLVDAAVGAWRRLQVQTGSNGGGYYPCLWGHAAFAASVFPPRRAQSGEFRHRIDLVVHGGFDLNQDNLEDALKHASSKAYVLQPVSESQPTVLKWGLAPLLSEPTGSSSAQPPEFALHSAASPDTGRDGAHPAFFLGGFMQGAAEDGSLIPSSSCGRVAVRGTWAEGPRGHVAQLPPLAALMSPQQQHGHNSNLYCRPLLLYYSDQLLVIENTDRFWLLDLQDQSTMEWAPVDTSLGPNEDVERWRIGCPVHMEFAINNPADPDEMDIPQNVPGSSPPNMRALQQQQQQQQGAGRGGEGGGESLDARRARRRAEERGSGGDGSFSAEQHLQQGGGGHGDAGATRVRKTRIVRRRKEPRVPDPPQPGDTRGIWKCLRDDKSGRCYYVNKETKKSTWKIEETVFVEPLEDEKDAYEEVEEQYWSDGNGESGSTPTGGAWALATSGEPRPLQCDNDNSGDQRLQHLPGVNGNAANSNWWNAAADAKVRNRDSSQQQQQHLNASRDPSVNPPSSYGGGPPSKAPSSSQLSVLKVPHVDLPIDFLIGDIDHEQEQASKAALTSPLPLAEQLMRNKQLQHQADLAAADRNAIALPAILAAESAVATIDPAEAIDYPFDIEAALLQPLSVVMRGRQLWQQRRETEYSDAKNREGLREVNFDPKKFLQRNTHWESTSDDGRREDHRRQQSAARGVYAAAGEEGKQRSVMEMLPSMLGKMAPAALSEIGVGPAAHRPGVFAAANWSRANSSDGDGMSTRGSTPVDAKLFGDVLDSQSRSSSVVSSTGMRQHHVSAAVREMFTQDYDHY